MRMFPLFFLLFIPFVANADCNYDIEAACIGAPGCYWNTNMPEGQEFCDTCPDGYYCPSGGDSQSTCKSNTQKGDGRCQCPAPFNHSPSEPTNPQNTVHDCYAKVTCGETEIAVYCDNWSSDGKCTCNTFGTYQWDKGDAPYNSPTKKRTYFSCVNTGWDFRPFIDTSDDIDLGLELFENANNAWDDLITFSSQYYHLEVTPKYTSVNYDDGIWKFVGDTIDIQCVKNVRDCKEFNRVPTTTPESHNTFLYDCTEGGTSINIAYATDVNSPFMLKKAECESHTNDGCIWKKISGNDTYSCLNAEELGVALINDTRCPRGADISGQAVWYDYDHIGGAYGYPNYNYWDVRHCVCDSGSGYTDSEDNCWKPENNMIGSNPGTNTDQDDIKVVHTIKEHVIFEDGGAYAPYCVRCKDDGYYAEYDPDQHIVTECKPVPTNHLGQIRVESASGYCNECDPNNDPSCIWQGANHDLHENPCELQQCPYPGTTTTDNTQIVHPGETPANYCKYGAETKFCDDENNPICHIGFSSGSDITTVLSNPGDWTIIDNE